LADESRYSPPKTPVADPSPPAVKLRWRPWPISVASILILLVTIDAFAKLAQDLAPDPRLALFSIFGLPFVALMLERAHGWARWLLLAVAVVTVLAVIPTIIDIRRDEVVLPPALRHYVLDLMDAILLVAAATLVFGPGREWFEKGKAPG